MTAKFDFISKLLICKLIYAILFRPPLTLKKSMTEILRILTKLRKRRMWRKKRKKNTKAMMMKEVSFFWC